MAQLVIAAAGAAIGGATLGTGIVAFGLTGTAIGWAAGSMLGSLLQKGPNAQGPRLNDLRVTGTECGQAHPWVAGSPRVPGQIVWASNKREIRNTQKVGKGGGGQRVTTFTYEVDLLYRLTENEIAGVSRIWLNGEVVFGNGQTKAGVWNEIRVYTGAADQMPDPTYEAAVGAGNAPAYRGGGSILIRGLQLGQSGQIPNLTFEVGTGFERRFSDVLYLFQPVGINPSFNDTSIYETRTFGAPTAIGDGVALVSGPFSHIILKERNQDFGFGDITGDFTIEADVKFRTDGQSVTDWYIFSVTNENTENGCILFARRQTTTSRLSFFKGTSISFNLFFPNNTTYDLLNGYKATLGVMQRGNKLKLYFAPENLPPVSQEFDLTDEIRDRVIIMGRNRQHRIGAAAGFDATNGMAFEIANFRLAKNAMYSLSDFLGVRPLPLTNFWQSENIGQQTPDLIDNGLNNLMARAGYQSSDYSVEFLDILDEKPLRAFAIGQISNTRSSVEVLQKAWYFEASKSDKIYIRPRAVTPVATIPWADLGTGEDAETDQEPLALQIGSDLELPAQIALSYNNMAADYNVATENSDRLITSQLSTASVQMPLGMLPDEAKGVANALLFDQLASLTSTTIRVPLRYAFVEPGDVINAINYDGRTYRLRVIAKRDTLSILELECVLDDVGALDSAAITDNSYISITDPARVAPTLFEPLDMPILRDADDDAGYYAAVAADRLSASDEWPGAVYVQAFSPGAFEQEFTTGDPCVMGEALTILPNWTGGNEFDESSTVNVEVVGELESSTRDLMLADLTVNAMLIGSEVIRFRLATLLSADGERRTYRLSGLLRGQRGTEWAIGGHVANERVILLNNALRRVPGLLTQIGLERDVKAVTLNLLLSDVPDVAFTNDAIGLKPFAPANVVALADGADLRITWQRRTRLSVRYGGPVDQVVPLGEVSEQYRVRIFDGPTLVHTATVTTPEYLYTDLTVDGFASGDPVTVEVAQLSAIVGAGYPTITTGTAT